MWTLPVLTGTILHTYVCLSFLLELETGLDLSISSRLQLPTPFIELMGRLMVMFQFYLLVIRTKSVSCWRHLADQWAQYQHERNIAFNSQGKTRYSRSWLPRAVGHFWYGLFNINLWNLLSIMDYSNQMFQPFCGSEYYGIHSLLSLGHLWFIKANLNTFGVSKLESFWLSFFLVVHLGHIPSHSGPHSLFPCVMSIQFSLSILLVLSELAFAEKVFLQ